MVLCLTISFLDLMVVMLIICDVSNVILNLVFFFQAEDGIRDLVRSRGLGDVYKRQLRWRSPPRVRPMLSAWR